MGVVTEEHVPQHLFGDLRSARIADEIGAELPLSDAAERHVVADDLPFVSLRVGDGVQRDMRVRWFDVVRNFDVRQFCAADDFLLFLRGQRVPGGEVVHVLLNDHIAAAREIAVLVTDEHRVGRDVTLGVLGAVDEAEEVALVEVLETVHLVHHGDRSVEAFADQLGQFETEIHVVRSHMEEQVTRGGRGSVPGARQRHEGMQIARAGSLEEPVPCGGADADDATQLRIRSSETDRSPQPGHILEQVANSGLAAGCHGAHEEQGGFGGRGDHELRLNHGACLLLVVAMALRSAG